MTLHIASPSLRPAGDGRRPRIAFLDVLKPQEISFLRDIIALVEPSYDIRFVHSRHEPVLQDAIAWADIVWLEWCLEPAVWATNTLKMRAHGKKVIVRLHSTEVIDGDCPHRVKWDAVDHLIFVSEDIRDQLLEQIPDLPQRVDCSVIPNGIDCAKFHPGAQAGDIHQVAWVGDVAMKKNPMMALQILRKLVDRDPAYHLHVAGEPNCLRTARYLGHLVDTMGLRDSVTFYGRIADIDAWYRDKSVLLSTTLYESFGMNIGEAMASGLWPVVHHFPGAEKTWPVEALFATVDQAVERIIAARPNNYRNFVLDHYSLPRHLDAVSRLLNELTDSFDPHAYWTQRHDALRGSIRSVGHIGLTDAQNLEDYAVNATHIRQALLARFPEPETKTLFDAGCGIGLVSALGAELGFTVIGADVSEIAVSEARRRVPGATFVAGAFDQVQLAPVDVVLCLDVLFHLVDDDAWRRGLQALTRNLKPGGRLLILEHFPDAPSEARHVRWRSLDLYRKAIAALGLTLSDVDIYRPPHLNAEKTLLVIDRLAADAGAATPVATDLPSLAPAN